VSTWAEDRRADRASAREQARLDAAARHAMRLEELQVMAGLDQADRDKRDARREQRVKAAGGWASGHVIELLIYPLAGVSALMAVPAMASYGRALYGDVTGYALPLISELGQWVFAMAVTLSRARRPERPVGMLTLGVAVFGAIAFGLNFAHGLSGPHGGLVRALVMAVVSVAGLVAHQLVTAAPRRARAERSARRLARVRDRRVERTQRVAVRRAPVLLAEDGSAELIHLPGLYAPGRRRLKPLAPTAPATARTPRRWGARKELRAAESAERAALAALAAARPPAAPEIGPEIGSDGADWPIMGSASPETLPMIDPPVELAEAGSDEREALPGPAAEPVRRALPAPVAPAFQAPPDPVPQPRRADVSATSEQVAAAEALERAALATGPGKRTTYRAVQETLGVRYATAKEALDRARERIAAETVIRTGPPGPVTP